MNVKKHQKDPESETSIMVHTYNLSYSRGRGRKIKTLKLALEKLMRPCLKNERTGCVDWVEEHFRQAWGHGFNPQYQKNKNPTTITTTTKPGTSWNEETRKPSQCSWKHNLTIPGAKHISLFLTCCQSTHESIYFRTLYPGFYNQPSCGNQSVPNWLSIICKHWTRIYTEKHCDPTPPNAEFRKGLECQHTLAKHPTASCATIIKEE
jgi:hypothetical protein